MKIRLLYLILLVCSLTVSVSAQDDTSKYKLRDLSAGEYLDGVLTTMSGPVSFDNRYFPDVIENVLFNEYPHLENEKWETLLKVYDWLGVGDPDPFLGGNRAQWNMVIIQAWLKQNQVDLSQTKQLKFADYEINVTARDFNNDGTNEYLLDVVKGATKTIDRKECDYAAEYVDYLVVQQDKRDYQIIRPASIPWHGNAGSGPIWRGSGGAVEIRFDDINADGLPEWVIAEGGEVQGGAGDYVSAGSLHVFSWRNNQLIDLTLVPNYGNLANSERLLYYENSGGGCHILPNDIAWHFANVDGDAALEILQHQPYVDNWYCESLLTARFDWDMNKDRYVYTSTDQDLADTQNCTQRQAEELMWKGDVQKALPLYEKAVSLSMYLPTGRQEQNELKAVNQYLRARLALVYILTLQPEKAQPLIHQLQQEAYVEHTTMYFVSALGQQINNPLQACIAAYNVFTEYRPYRIYGVTVEPSANGDQDYLPQNIGCNAPQMVADLLTKHPFTTDQSPVDEMKMLDLDIQKVMQFDLNNDGHQEWLIWLKSPMSPFFFAPDGNTYRVSQVEVNSYLSSGEMSTWTLPGNLGQAIVFIPTNMYFDNSPPWHTAYYAFYDGEAGFPETCITEGRESINFVPFLMWRMDDHSLIPIFNELLCRDNLNDIFPAGEGSPVLDGGRYKEDDSYSYMPTTIVNMVYRWDSNEKTYKLAPVSSSPTPTAVSTSIRQSQYGSPIAAFEAHDFNAVIQLIGEPTLSDYADFGKNDAPHMLTHDYYLRALALQHLGHDQEAIEAFLKMIEVAPNEQWKKLAMLYLEPV